MKNKIESKMAIEYRNHGDYVRAWNEDLTLYGKFEEFPTLTFEIFKSIAKCFDIEVIQLDKYEDSRWD